MDQLVRGNVDLLRSMLQRVVACRETSNTAQSQQCSLEADKFSECCKYRELIIPFSDFLSTEDAKIAADIELDDVVEEQLHSFVQSMEELYHPNPCK